MEARRVTVVGGANTDICGRPAHALVRRDSAPGRVSVTHGGVGRNIACDLAPLRRTVTSRRALMQSSMTALEFSLPLGIERMTSSTPALFETISASQSLSAAS